MSLPHVLYLYLLNLLQEVADPSMASENGLNVYAGSSLILGKQQ